MTDTMIVTQRLSKAFGENAAVNDLTLSIPAGEVFGLLGPNGAGKTTTIRMLSALIAPSSGTASVCGYQVGQQDMQIRQNVGILTESPGLYDRLSAERNLSFFAGLYDVSDIAGQVEKYLRMLGLWTRRHEEVGGFSKGMRQKLAIARALLHEPKVLFLDEPTAGLDPETSLLVRSFIDELRHAGRTILITTHNLDEADRLCDRIAVFKTHLLALDSPANLRRALHGRTVVFHLRKARPQYLESIRSQDFVHTVEQVEDKLIVSLEDPESDNPRLVQLLVAQGADIQFIGELRRTLEDVYLSLVQNPQERY